MRAGESRACSRKRAIVWSLWIGLVSVAALTTGQQTRAQNAVEVKPSPQQSEWQDLEFGVTVPVGLNTFLNQEWGDGSADPKVFGPAQLVPDQWVAKHDDGFRLWRTGQTRRSTGLFRSRLSACGSVILSSAGHAGQARMREFQLFAIDANHSARGHSVSEGGAASGSDANFSFGAGPILNLS